MMSPRYALIAVLVAASCGGKELGSTGSPDASDEGVVDDAGPPIGPSDGAPLDAFIVPEDSPSTTSDGEVGESGVAEGGNEGGVTCEPGTSSSSGGSGGSCSTMATEKCSNGFAYQVTCSCPAATCMCTQMKGGGAGGNTVKYGGCASDCGNPSDAWEACGFPQP